MIAYEPTTEELVRDLMDCYTCKFTYGAAHAMIEWLEEVYSGCTFKWDPVGIGCDFTEYDSLEEWGCEYFGGRKEMMEGVDCVFPSELDEHLEDYINSSGSLIGFDGGILVSSF
jgi:hypothetical protein